LDAHTDAGKSAYPVWVRLVRAGTKFSAYYKTSATAAWTAIGQAVTPQGASAATPSQIALFSLSHNDTAEAKTVFDDFACQGNVTGLSAPAARAGYLGGYGPGDRAWQGWGWSWGREPRRADGKALR
jgi:hypothetical protein